VLFLYLLLFGLTRLTVFMNPDFFKRTACFNQSSGNLGSTREKVKEHADKLHKIGEFSFRDILQSTTVRNISRVKPFVILCLDQISPILLRTRDRGNIYTDI